MHELQCLISADGPAFERNANRIDFVLQDSRANWRISSRPADSRENSARFPLASQALLSYQYQASGNLHC
jgi:hypothetical protein